MLANITISEYPYNLTELSNTTNLAEFYAKVNSVGNNIPIYGFFVIVFTVSFYIGLANDYDMPSSIGFGAILCFVMSIIGRLAVFNDVPLVPTHLVIFFGILGFVCLGIIKFSGN